MASSRTGETREVLEAGETGEKAPLGALLRRSLARTGGPEARVEVLGFRDEFAAATGRLPATGPPPGTAAPGAVPVHVYGQHVIVGPVPAHEGGDAPGCRRCLARRWQSVRSVPMRDALETGGATHAAGEWPYATPFAADAVAALVTAAQERGRGGAFPQVHLLDLATLTVRSHPLVPDPQCPGCARPRPDTEDGARIELSAAPEHAPGALRVRALETYGIDVAAFANPVCGALGPSVVHDVSSTSTSATIGCFSMRSGEYLRETFWGGHADSFAASARIGVLEGLERYAGMRARAKTTRVRGTLEEFGEQAVDPRQVGLYPDAFHRDNPRVTPFAPDREIPWVWGYSLRDATPRLVPEVLTYYHAPGLENRFVQESSNGCASGGCLEEACYFGLMEVIERDAFLLAWYGQQPLPEIDPGTSERASVRHMVDRLAMYGYRARFFDTRISFPVPVITGVAERFDGGTGRMCFGAGAGADPEAALEGALCEIATDAVNLPGRTASDEERLRAMAADFGKVTALHDHPLLYGIPEMGRYADFLLAAPQPTGPRRVGELRLPGGPDGGGSHADGAPGDVREVLRRCVDAVTAAGFDVVVVDQTLPEQRTLGLHTVSVLVPGLLPIDFGWSRQRARVMPRMFTALKEAGLRGGDLRPCDLNPAPHPFP